LIPCSNLSEAQRLEAARLAAEALPSIYGSVGDEAFPMLAAEFLVAGSELADAVAISNSVVEGIVASYAADQCRSRQLVSLHHALHSLSAAAGARLIAQLRSVSDLIPTDQLRGQYVARFAVPNSRRGTGAADRLMNLFTRAHPVVTLHVRSDNARAIRFYRRHGFVEQSSGEFLLMTRDPSA
jgi:ribosomal protein S18 acetylase RimI-like enzyme